MTLTLTAKQKQRIDTASNWTSANPVLLTGEIGLESDTGKAKVGDGSTAWSSLAYTAFGGLPKTGGTMTGAILGDDSTSASTPGYAFDGDANTGLLRTGADAVALVTGGTAAVSVDSSQNVVLSANLTVNGTTTTIDTQNLDVEDKNITIGKVSTPSDTTADGGGITLKGASDKTITWTDSTDSWDFNQHVNIATGKEYKVNNVSVLSSTTLGTSVVGSSLTSVGTIGTGTWQGSVIGAAYLPDASTSAEGVVQLEDSTTSTSTTKAATPASVKATKDVADLALPKAGGQISGNITCAGSETVDGRDLSVDGAKLDGIEASADVTDATNVNAAGAIMESDVDAKGDILAGTADNTVARLAVGTNGYVLKADSSTTTGLAWGADSATDSTKLPLAGGTLSGDLLIDNQKDLRFGEADSNGSNYVAFQAPSTISSDVTWTLPATDGTTGQALTTDGSGALSWSSGGSDKLPLTGGTLTGDLSLDNQKDLRFLEADSNGSNYVAFQAPASISSNVIWTLPATDGTSGQVMKTDASGNLSWGDAGGSTTGTADLLDIASSSGTGGGSATFNGTAYRFKLVTKGTSNAVTPSNAEILRVSLNGVMQKPNDGTGQGDMTEGYVVSGTDIIFDSPPAASSDYFIINMGATIAIGTPGDGTVSTAKIVSNAVDGTKIAMGSDAAGDVLYYNGTDYARLGIGSATQVLKVNAGATAPEWGTAEGATADGCLYENNRTISNNHTIASGKGAHCVGPLTINATLTIQGRLVIS